MENKDKEELELIKRTNRRRQAWCSFLSIIAIVFCYMFIIPESRLSLINEVIITAIIAFAGIVAAYHGSSAWIAKK